MPTTPTIPAVNCPLCGQRKARRACPALGKSICPVCCGTKQLIEIQCPETCPYLTTAREHPPAAEMRRQQSDVSPLARAMRDLNERQSRLFFLVLSFLVSYKTPGLYSLADEDVTEAMDALAATFETASRGVIYEHRPTSLPAERLANDLKPLLTEAGGRAGSAFERDAVVVLRRIETAGRDAGRAAPDNRRAFLELIGRVISKEKEEPRPSVLS